MTTQEPAFIKEYDRISCQCLDVLLHLEGHGKRDFGTLLYAGTQYQPIWLIIIRMVDDADPINPIDSRNERGDSFE